MADFTKHSFAKKNRMKTDVLLIGSGIMSSTLGAMLKELQPGFSIQLY